MRWRYGDVLTQRRRGAECAEGFEPRDTQNRRNWIVVIGYKEIVCRRLDI